MKNLFNKIVNEFRLNSVIFRDFIKKFIVCLTATTVAIVALAVVLCYFVEKSTEEYGQKQILGIEMASEVYFRDIEYASSWMLTSKTAQLLAAGAVNEKNINDLNILIESNLASRKAIHSIYIYLPKHELICDGSSQYPTEEFYDVSWLDELDKEFDRNFRVTGRKIDLYPNVLSFIQKDSTGNVVVVYNLNLYEYHKSIESLINKEAELSYLVKNGEILYAQDEGKIFSDTSNVDLLDKYYKEKDFECSDYTIISRPSDYYGWEYVIMMDNGYYNSEMRYIFFITVILIMIGLLFSFIISVKMTFNSVDILDTILNLIENREKIKYMDESKITYFSKKIISIIEDNELLRTDIEKRVSEINLMKIQLYQLQINPHFLNNTMSVINNQLVANYGAKDPSSKMIINLSRMFNYCIETDKIFGTISEEIDFLQKYMSIIMKRYNNIRFEIEADENLYSKRMLKLLLQPIVENSCFYSKKEKENHISVNIGCDDNKTKIVVLDTGMGMDEQELARTRQMIYETEDKSFDRIGLKNVYRRIKLVYGDNGDFIIESEKDKYTKIIIIFGE